MFEITFESNYIKLAAFKKKHYREGEFTDEDGVIALATGFYLGVTLRIFSSSNTKRHPYTEHNANQPVIFNIFLDDRTTNSEHFQSLKQPEAKVSEKDQVKGSEPKDSKTNRSSGEVWVDYIDRFHNEKSKKMQDAVSSNETQKKEKQSTQQVNSTNNLKMQENIKTPEDTQHHKIDCDTKQYQIEKVPMTNSTIEQEHSTNNWKANNKIIPK